MSLTFAPRPKSPPTGGTEPDFTLPAADLTEQENGFELLVELPGVSRENLEITVENGLLRITGKRDTPLLGTPIIREIHPRDFSREFRLGSTIDTTAISAALDRGVLRLKLPKLPQSQLRHIPLEEMHP